MVSCIAISVPREGTLTLVNFFSNFNDTVSIGEFSLPVQKVSEPQGCASIVQALCDQRPTPFFGGMVEVGIISEH